MRGLTKCSNLLLTILEKVSKTFPTVCFDRTAGTIEAWNLMLKRNDHLKHRKRPDIFIKEHFPIQLGRQLAFIDNMNLKESKKLKVIHYFQFSHSKFMQT